MTSVLPASESTERLARFERAICGVDGSPEATAAAAQARRLLGERGELIVVAAADPWTAVLHARGDIEVARRRQFVQHRGALVDAEHELNGALDPEIRLREGSPREVLLDEVRREQADLVALGFHGSGPACGFITGSVATLLVHEAPCSVLLARLPPSPSPFPWPRRVVVGVDGSPHSRLALAHARTLAGTLGARVQALSAAGGKRLDLDAVVAAVGTAPHAYVSRDPVEALVEASRSSDLVIVGSRGVRGLATLGSVSERVAHRSACSVLVVRGCHDNRRKGKA